MLTIGPLGFTAPWLLLGLLILPLLWLLLRAVPPAPVRRRFPGVVLLLGLRDNDSQSARTPWWLLVLRLFTLAALITGFAGPVLNPQNQQQTGSGPLLIIADGTWADARDWSARQDRMTTLLANASRQGRSAAITTLTTLPAGPLSFQAANTVAQQVANLRPQPWEPNAEALAAFAAQFDGAFDTYWLSDGLDRAGRTSLLAALENHGSVTVFQTPRQTLGLRPAQTEDGTVILSSVRTPTGNPATQQVSAIGLDPAGVTRELATATLVFAAGDAVAETRIDLPPELRNRITRFELPGARSAGAVSLADDTLKRREVALIAGRADREGLELLSPLHYLTEALAPSADLINGDIADLLLANPDVIILADVANLPGRDSADVLRWVENGGMLLRFAGPRLAASELGRTQEDPLLPVRLRASGRSVGGAMSWGEPKALAPFHEDSPFFGLPIPDDVFVTSQVVAQPDPTLSARVIAQLADGTPLVTRKTHGEGQIVLVHVTANAEWSNLPLSGLFVQMLERLAVSTSTAELELAEMEGTTWLPSKIMTAQGQLEDVGTLAGIDGALLVDPVPGPGLIPGLYTGNDRQIAVNVITPETTLGPAIWPARIVIEGLTASRETGLKGWLLALAIGLLFVDIIASLLIGGRLRGPRSNAVAIVLGVTCLAAPADAQNDDFAIRATSETVLGHVLTGNADLDEIANAGLTGLSQTLFRRTSIEPAAPLGVDIETDELAFFPFLYWPITADQPLPSREAYGKLNRYLRSGGMILFDTRDANTAGFGSGTPEGRKLQAIARTLDIPVLEPIPDDHVLTRTFYLLQDFPGRYASRDIWVEAAPLDANQAEGMPFRNLNDGVTPVVIGGNDWARAWAIDAGGNRMFPVGRGQAGERQREIAYRFGVNLIMHVLTGNYKSDQVHVPALLDRLGQ